MFAVDLAVRVICTESYPETLTGIKMSLQGNYANRRTNTGPALKDFLGFFPILTFLFYFLYQGGISESLSSVLPAEASFPLDRDS